MSGQQEAMRSPISWYGGKGQMAAHIVALLPPHDVYCEPCAGGLAVLFAKAPAPLEIINDLDEDLMQFYRVLRNPALFEEFARLCALTPYSRAEWRACRASWKQERDPIQRVWKWFVTVRQGFNGNAAQGPGSGWRYSRFDPGSSAVSRYLSAVAGLADVHARLSAVQIECQSWEHLLQRYDAPGVCFYVDPPYVLAARGDRKRYSHEMTLAQHHDLVARLLECRACVVLSGYRVAGVHGPLEVAGWERQDRSMAVGSHMAPIRQRHIESIWRNPAAVQAWQTAQWPLFAAHAASSGPPLRGTEEG